MEHFQYSAVTELFFILFYYYYFFFDNRTYLSSERPYSDSVKFPRGTVFERYFYEEPLACQPQVIIFTPCCLTGRTSLKLFCSFSRNYIFRKLGARFKFVCIEFSTVLAQIWRECSHIIWLKNRVGVFGFSCSF